MITGHSNCTKHLKESVVMVELPSPDCGKKDQYSLFLQYTEDSQATSLMPGLKSAQRSGQWESQRDEQSKKCV